MKITPEELVQIVGHYEIDHTELPTSSQLQSEIKGKIGDEFFQINPDKIPGSKSADSDFIEFLNNFGGEALFRLKAHILFAKRSGGRTYRTGSLRQLVTGPFKLNLSAFSRAAVRKAKMDVEIDPDEEYQV